ncbi:MAG: substrate-binding domain-containing protein [Bifidobacteriaceae bacterium]|nr:substrate-binding domain-containing protein [Bifidobacteriaceae bacterium]
MTRNSKRALGVISAATAVLALCAGPAMADPGAYRPLAGAGSDTTQYVLGGLGEAISIGGAKVIGSYDAIGSATIQTRAAGPSFVRPNGSGNGVKALTASINPTGAYLWNGVEITGQLDFARSSSGPSTAGDDLTYIPFAKDAVTYAFSDAGNASVPAQLTVDDLAAIYRGQVTTYQDNNGVTRAYIPMLPQAGSGTRSFFLQKIGVAESEIGWITSIVQENDGQEVDAIGEIVPFSVASWIAQDNDVVPNTVNDNAVTTGAIDDDMYGVVPAVEFGLLNPDFPITRQVYNVVQTSRLTSEAPADVLLQQTFAGAESAVCGATATITAYGFGVIADCGDTTTYRSGYVVP